MARAASTRSRRVAGALLVAVLAGAVVVKTVTPASAIVPCTTPACITAVDDNYTAAFKAKVTVAAPGLLLNDIGPLDTTIDIADSDTTSENGATVRVQKNGGFTYTPDPKNPFTGVDSFDYTIQDGDDDTDFASAYITVLPVVVDDSYNAPANQTLTIAAPGVAANDIGVDATTVDIDATSAHGADIIDDNEGAFEYTPPPGFTGPDTFTYTVYDLDFDNFYTGTVHVNVDGTRPLVAMSAPGPVTLSTTVQPRWSGSDASGIAHYDVQEATAVWNSTFHGWANWKLSTVALTGTTPGVAGRTYCFRAQATDLAGNVSGWTQRCTAVPIRATGFVYSKGWVSTPNTVYYGGTGIRTSTKGATATRTLVQAQHLWLVATKCTTCGTVQVRLNNVVVATVSLHGTATAHRQLVPIGAFTSVRNGTLKLIVTTTGKPVLIEGLAVLRA